MPVVPPHIEPDRPRDYLDTWAARGRICVPDRQGAIADILICQLIEGSSEYGQFLDAVIDGRRTINNPIKRFGVRFCDYRPGPYQIPVLWIIPKTGEGTWLKRYRLCVENT